MDEEIEKRLRGLDETVAELSRKQKSKELQKEIELRLAKLNERDPNFYSKQEPPVKLLSIKKHQTEIEEADDLVKRFMEEVQLDEKSRQQGEQMTKEMEDRIKELAKAQADLNYKKSKLKKFKKTGELVHQLMMIRTLENRNNKNISDDEEGDELEQQKQQLDDEIDWCTTCNEDGVVRCLDCDNDIYCKDCFLELHRDRDMRGHRTQPYKTQSSSSS